MVSVLCCLCVLTRRKSVQASAEQTCMGQASSQIMLVYPALANVQAHVACDWCTILAAQMLSLAEPWWQLSATIFKCYQRSQITDYTIEPFCLSEKLISTLSTNNTDTTNLPTWSWTLALLATPSGGVFRGASQLCHWDRLECKRSFKVILWAITVSLR